MKKLLRTFYPLLVTFGFDPLRTIRSLKGIVSYCRDIRALKRQKPPAARDFPFGTPYPCFQDRATESGSAKGHYFHQDLLVARRVYAANPRIHVDVGSRIDGFVAHVASFRPIEVLDIRPLSGVVPNITFRRVDLMAPLAPELVDYCDSLSCLHTVEHFGLGRYGDPLNYDGHLVGLDNLWKILKSGGTFYFSVPIGPQRIEFNAHRVFSVRFLLDFFSARYRVNQFSFVDDRGDLHEDVAVTDADAKDSFGCVFGCGIFELTKR
jgi:SAM-dependent methyltransferase